MVRELVIEADGGSRGNPGVAGYGALVRDGATGDLLAERAAPLGKASNNVAEYSGLVAGLRAAEEIDPGARLTVRMDSKLVIEQMAGRWKIKHEDMKRLAVEASVFVRRRREQGGSITWTWIPREINKDADKLSNDGMDGQTIVRNLWESASGSTTGDAAGHGEAAREPTTPATLFDAVDGEATEPSAPTAAQRPDASEATTIILLRHGVTDFTVTHRLDGRGGADPSLNEQGLRQASAAAQHLAAQYPAVELSAPIHLVTSSMARAMQTGAAVATSLGATAQVDDNWDEQHVGAWDGLTFPQIEEKYPGQLSRMRCEPDFRPEGGESNSEFAARVAQGFRGAVDAAGAGGTAVVATHRKPLMVVLSLLLGISGETAWMLDADPASLTTVRVWPDGRAVVRSLNATHHLR